MVLLLEVVVVVVELVPRITRSRSTLEISTELNSAREEPDEIDKSS